MQKTKKQKREKKRPTRIYKCIHFIIRTCYPKVEVIGEENLPEEGAIVVGNHSQIHGPVTAELYFPGEKAIWCAGQMMQMKDVPAYAYKDFWSDQPKWIRWFFKGLSYVIAPLSVCIFNNAHTIGVYHDARIMSTFKTTIKKLQTGTKVVIYPEHDVLYNEVVNDFQEHFIDVAKLYYGKTKQALSFVPLYHAPRLKKMYIGKPIAFCPEEPIEKERLRIKQYLMEEITKMARSLPPHEIVQYRNKPRDVES